MKLIEQVKLPSPDFWKRLKESQVWAANAPLPLTSRLFRTNHLVKNWVAERGKFSTSQLRILFEAMEPDGVSQSTICKNHDIDPAGVTRTVQAMERDGLVMRHTDPIDNRLMRVFITDKGREIVNSMPAQIATIEREMLKDWTDEEILQLHHLLEKLENSLT